MKKENRPNKGDTVFFNHFGAISVDSQKTKKHFTLLVDGEDVYGWLVGGKIKPIRESDARFSIKAPLILNAQGAEEPAQEGTILDVWRPEYDLQ